MRSVRFVVPGDDESPETDDVLVVEAGDGERFELTVDDALRAAVAAPAQDDRPDEESPAVTPVRTAPIGPPLSPRDIQVRVRSGESPEDLAADTDTPIDKIMRFAYPVLEERARIGDEARRSRARRDGDGDLVPFGDTVDRRFLAHDIDPSSVSWDSFRRPDGSWVVIASWLAGEHERQAHWTFSLAARTVLAADDVGSDLLSDRPLRPVVRAVPDHEEAAPGEGRDEVYDQEAPTAYPSPARHEAPPLPLRLAEPLHPRPAVVASLDADGDAIIRDIGFDELFDANLVDEPSARDDGPEPPAPVSAPPQRRGSGRSKAAREQTKIPSWDDILLGVRRKQE